MMIRQHRINLILLAAMGVFASGCSDSKTTLIEKDATVDDHDHSAEHEGQGRLVVFNATNPEAMIYDLDENSVLDAFSLTVAPSAVYASGGYRYAVMVDRAGDSLGFLDGGVWQEEHGDHFHDEEQAPILSSYSLSGSRPTQLVRHEGQLAIFYDGDAATESPASITVITDADITGQNPAPASLSLSTNMHGAAVPLGEHLLSSIRRGDGETTSSNVVLPDQVAVYHLHDGAYEQEQIVEAACPDLHGAAHNHSRALFGCADGVLVVHEHEGNFAGDKIANAADMAEGLRIGSIFGHQHNDQFLGLASAHGGARVQWFSIDPAAKEMELIDWQPVDGARVVSRGFSFEGEHFVILDSQGYLTVLEAHEHDGRTHWEYGARLDITQQDVANMPEGVNFSMTIAQNAHIAYIADPLAQHVMVVDLDLMQVIGDIELDYVPASVTWLGVAEDHDHDR